MFNSGAAGIVFGVLLLLLGIATWIFTRFGEISWYDMSALGKGVAGVGSIVGNAFLYTFFFIFFATIWVIKLFTNTR
jgi:hypothetical protein